MEGVIACFFDSVFTDMERDGLGARYKRRGISDYLSSVVGSTEDIAENCGHAVKAACRIHSEARAGNGSICPLGKHHNILYVAAKLSFDWRLQDGESNALLLNNIFSCERTFERLVIAGILGPLVTRLLSGWQADFRDEEESLCALEFFLGHSVREKMVYRMSATQTERMPDVPMPAYHDALPAHLACVMDRPDALLVLLRYGARVGTAEHGAWEEGAAPTALVHQLLRLGEAASRGSVVPMNAVVSLQVLMRALPHVALQDDTLRLYAEALLPRQRWADPPELKHLARCAVRRQLWRDWCLPQGVTDLPIPTTLHAYIDLKED